MPELPEVETVRRTLDPALVGCRVAGVSGRPVKMRLPLDPALWESQAVGARLLSVGRHGKYLICRFDRVAAVLHLGMSGQIKIHTPPTATAPHTHLVLRFEEGRELHFVDPRRFGFAALMAPEQVASFEPLARLGPDALEPEAAEALLRTARRSKVPIHALLLDQGVLAGIGNIYAAEALHRSGIHPGRRASSLSHGRLARLGETAREVLLEAIAAGGTTLSDGGFVAADGRQGYFAVRLAVYDREGEACQRCGERVRRRVLRGRSVYFCSGCQH